MLDGICSTGKSVPISTKTLARLVYIQRLRSVVDPGLAVEFAISNLPHGDDHSPGRRGGDEAYYGKFKWR